MKSEVVGLFFILLLVGFVIGFSENVIAKEGNDSESDSSGSGSGGDSDDSESSGSGSDGDKDSSGSEESGVEEGSVSDDDDKTESKTVTTVIDEDGNEVTIKMKIKTDEDGETETKETRSYIDENGNEVKIEIRTYEDGGTETKETRSYIDENGNEIKIVIKTEVKDGESKTEEKKTITTSDGIEITFKTKVEMEDGESVTKTSVKINGAEFSTKLSVKEIFEDGESKLIVKLSTGADQNIIVQPDEALLIAIEELNAGNISMELVENGEGERAHAVFKATTTEEGGLLGFFNVQVDLETLIDTETGEIIQTTRPWWAFLVVGADQETMCHVSGADQTRGETINIALTEVKMHLGHGDSVGACVSECGDGIIIEGVELCEAGDTQTCTTLDGYGGVRGCSSTCDAFDECISSERCGDGLVNGDEACDDGNSVIGDGCDNLCEIEVVIPSINETNLSV